MWFGKFLTSPQAREYYYRGISHFCEMNKEDNAIARKWFEQLYEVEPNTVVGPSMVASTHWGDGFNNWSDSSTESMENAATWARKSIEYEDNNGLGHAILGHIELLKGNFEVALELCETGANLRSSCPMAHGVLGLVHNYRGEPQSAIQNIKKALNLERIIYPTWLINGLATAYRDGGDVDLSVTAANESIKRDHEQNEARLILCCDYQLTSEHEQARRVAGEILKSDPDFSISTFTQTQPYKDHMTLDRLASCLREASLPD